MNAKRAMLKEGSVAELIVLSVGTIPKMREAGSGRSEASRVEAPPLATVPVKIPENPEHRGQGDGGRNEDAQAAIQVVHSSHLFLPHAARVRSGDSAAAKSDCIPADNRGGKEGVGNL
jgi:hypothetical protein